MIRSIEIQNFRCYRRLKVSGCKRVNLIVGENGSGKTAFLEAMFLALAASAEVGLRFRQQRGLDNAIGGTTRRIEDGLWGDLFTDNDWTNPIFITLTGEGPEARSLRLARGIGETTLPLAAADLAQMTTAAPVTFTWTDSKNQARSVTPRVQQNGAVVVPDTGEDLPNFFFFSSASQVGSNENAGRFSELSKVNKHRDFVKTFSNEYPWIEDLSIEIHTGAPAVFATVKSSGRKMPVANLSGAVNKVLSIMLAVASSEKAVIIVDEIENGIFHTHLTSVWKTLVRMLEERKSQIFASTHSQECIEALIRAATKSRGEILLMRAQRDKDGVPEIKTFSGETLFAGIEYGEEVR